MSVWAGVDNGAPTAEFSPQEFVPSDPYQLQWPMWGTYVSTQGRRGQRSTIRPRRSWSDLYDPKWLAREDFGDPAAKIWTVRFLDINADQVFSIGIVTATLVPIVVSNKLHNVPVEGISAIRN